MKNKYLKQLTQTTAHYLRLLYSRRRTWYTFFYKYAKVDSRIILYESFFGRGMLCGPWALFLELSEDPEYKNYTHVWVLDKLKDHADLLEKYKSAKNVCFVERNSISYYRFLCTAGYLINNVTFPSYFSKKEGQVYVNTWHGIPLKSLGYDMPNGNTEVTNVIRNFLHTDYMVSACDFLTDIYKNAYKLDQLYTGKFIEEGYPRLDILFRFSREEILQKLSKTGMKIDPSRKIILYAPTWRGASYARPDLDVEHYYSFKKELESRIDLTEYQLLIKVHQRVFELAKDKLDPSCFIPATIDGNEALAVSDILISDFSSIFYDYLATDRPVLFYIPNMEEYSQERGLYSGIDSLPGPCTESISHLGSWIGDIDHIQQEYQEKYNQIKAYSNAFYNGSISKKIVDIVFRKNEAPYRISRARHDKKKIFISRGMMLPNGITTSCLNLLNHIDYSQYDVSLLVCQNNRTAESDLIYQVNPNVRVFYRNSPANTSMPEHLKMRIKKKLHVGGMVYGKELDRECRRCYGPSEFDYLIDFEGYNFFNASLLLHMKGGTKVIWQHNDMISERDVRFPQLTDIFELYRHFDRVVACSGALMEINRKKMGEAFHCTEKFAYAKNMLDTDYIQNRLAQADHIPDYPGLDCPDAVHFVTIGRLSPEKNQAALIRAFGKFHTQHPDSYLYILGDGPLKAELQTLIHQQNLDSSVIMTGNVENPFAILKYCDCFILASLHEGQPMVIHEARILHMPIIVSTFSSVAGSVIDHGQLLIPPTEEGILQGMNAFVNGQVPTDYIFDEQKYNAEAYQEFLTAIGAQS